MVGPLALRCCRPDLAYITAAPPLTLHGLALTPRSRAARVLCAVLCCGAEYKNRGPMILKSSDTAELIEKLEDSQMTLGSMATNRCVVGGGGSGFKVGLSRVEHPAEQHGRQPPPRCPRC